MRKILYRYTAKEIITPFFLGLTIFTFILLMSKVLKLTEMVVSKGAKVSEVASLILYILPSFFVVTIPMAFLLALLLAFGRLSTDEEFTAVKASGTSLVQMMPPAMLIAFIAFIINLYLMVFALPWGNHSFKIKMYDIIKRKADTGIIPGRVVDTFENMVLYVSDKDKITGQFKGVMLSDEKEGNTLSTIVAERGEVITTPGDLAVTLRLYDGTIHRKGLKEDIQYKTVDFTVYDITLSMSMEKNQSTKISKGDRELGIRELLSRMEKLKKEGRNYNFLLVELHKKFSIPFACIVFVFIGVPLGIQGKRSGKAHGFTVSLVLIIIYWAFLIGGEALGDKGRIPPFISMWAPNIFFLTLGLYFMIKVNDESEIKILSLFEKLFGLIAGILRALIKQTRKR